MEAKETIYLDYNSTTPCASEVLEAMLPYFSEQCGNSGSPHRMGRTAAAAVEQSRTHVAELIGCSADELVFTSGATESNNMVLLGVSSGPATRRKIVTTAVEHKSVLEPCEHLASQGFEVVRVPVDERGVVDVNAAEQIIDRDTLLVSIQAANNEVGTIQPVAHIAEMARSQGALVHSDWAQAVGKIAVSVQDLGVDFASFSAHKAYGPKGIGALFIRRGDGRSRLSPASYGGGQEGGLRPGTHNVPAIVGFGEACRLAKDLLQDEAARLARYRDSFERNVLACLDGVRVNGSVDSRLPGTTSLCIADVPADALVANLPWVCISEGSACTSGALGASHVLLAMGLSRKEAESTIRVAVGRYTVAEEMISAADHVKKAVARLRDFGRHPNTNSGG